MSLKKQLLKSKPICKVTFRVSKEAAKDAKCIHVVGDFNDWSKTANPMKPLKNGEFTAQIDVNSDTKQYQFRYIYDETLWENDWQADGYADNGQGTENSILRI